MILTQRAAHIVRGLLDFARQSEPSMSPTNINEEINKVLSILEHELRDIKVVTLSVFNDQEAGERNRTWFLDILWEH